MPSSACNKKPTLGGTISYTLFIDPATPTGGAVTAPKTSEATCLAYTANSSPTGFFFNHTATTEIYTLSLHDALPISSSCEPFTVGQGTSGVATTLHNATTNAV